MGALVGVGVGIVALSHPSVWDRQLVGAILGSAAVAAGLVAWHRQGSSPLHRDQLLTGGLWIAALLMSWAVHGVGSWPPAVVLAPIIGVGLMCVGSQLGRDTRAVGRAVQIVLVAATAVSLHALSQHAGLDPIPRIDDFPHRVVGPFLNPNHLASFTAVALVLAVAGFLQRSRSHRIAPVVACGVVVLLLYACLLLAGSRGAIAAAGAGAIAVVGLSAWRRSHPPVRVVPLVVLSVALIAVTVLLQERAIMKGPAGEVSVGQRLQALSNIAGDASRSDLTVVHRRILWRSAWDTFLDQPLWGVGPGNFADACSRWLQAARPDDSIALLTRQGRLATHEFAHNEILHSLAETGLAGTLPLMLLFVSWVTWQWRHLDALTPEKCAAIGGCLVVLVHGLVSYPLFLPASLGLFWILLGISLSDGEPGAARR